MTLAEFKQEARSAFGASMEHATPANVREFRDVVARERWREEQTSSQGASSQEKLPIEITQEKVSSYEEILREFFADMLSAPNEQALIHLWLLALDMAYAGLEEQAEQQIGSLFSNHPSGE
jgi:hypothetical protein